MSTLETNLIQPSTGTTLTVGASGDTITVPSGATFNIAGTAGTNIGKVLQVVNGTVGQTDMANTDDYIGSGLSITPSSTSSKIQIFVDGYVEQTTGSAGNYAELQLHEATTGITTLNNAITYQYTVGARIPFSINFADEFIFNIAFAIIILLSPLKSMLVDNIYKLHLHLFHYDKVCIEQNL